MTCIVNIFLPPTTVLYKGFSSISANLQYVLCFFIVSFLLLHPFSVTMTAGSARCSRYPTTRQCFPAPPGGILRPYGARRDVYLQCVLAVPWGTLLLDKKKSCGRHPGGIYIRCLNHQKAATLQCGVFLQCLVWDTLQQLGQQRFIDSMTLANGLSAWTVMAPSMIQPILKFGHYPMRMTTNRGHISIYKSQASCSSSAPSTPQQSTNQPTNQPLKSPLLWSLEIKYLNLCSLLT